MGSAILEAIMMVTGLIILLTRKVKIGRVERTGWQATAIGLSLFLPLPLILLMGLLIAVFVQEDVALLAAIELGNTAELGLALGGLVAAVVFFSLPVRHEKADSR